MPLTEFQNLKEITAPVYEWEIAAVTVGEFKKLQAVQNLNPSESMDLTESYVIGGKYGGNVEPFELVPGNVKDKTLDLSVVVLHGVEETGLSVFTVNDRVAYDWMEVMDQGLKFNIKEIKTYYDETNTKRQDLIMYEKCYLNKVSLTRDITRGDLREIAALSINYLNLTETLNQEIADTGA